MRHKLNLPEQPNIIFLILVFDLIAIVAVYGLYGTNWIGQTGYKLELPASDRSSLPISPNHLLVKIFGEGKDTCVIGRKAIPFTDFRQELAKHKSEFQLEEVLLMMDKSAPISKEREVISTIHGLGLRCTIVTEPKATE